MIDTHTKEEVLIKALPYIQTYEGKTFVIKYGGAAMRDERLKETFAKDVTILTKDRHQYHHCPWRRERYY